MGELKQVSQKRKTSMKSRYGRYQPDLGECDPLISTITTTPSKISFITSFCCLIGFLLCFILAVLFLVQYSRGGLPIWKLFLSMDNQDHISQDHISQAYTSLLSQDCRGT